MRFLLSALLVCTVLHTSARAGETLHPRSEHRIEVGYSFGTANNDVEKFNGQFSLYESLLQQQAEKGDFISMPRLMQHIPMVGLNIAYSTGDWRYAAFTLFPYRPVEAMGYYEARNDGTSRQIYAEQTSWVVGAECGWYLLSYDHYFLYPYASLFASGTEFMFSENSTRQSAAHTVLGGALGIALDLRVLSVPLSSSTFIDISPSLRLQYNQPLVSLYESHDAPQLVPLSASGVQFGIHGFAAEARLALSYNY